MHRQFVTNSGIPVKEVYTPDDLDRIGFDYDYDLGLPGRFPYTRGIDPLMYRANLWVMGQYSGFGSAEESNERYRYLVSQGATGFSIALDLPTQIGLDSDDPLAEGEVGRVGVAIDSLADIEVLFRGIPMDKVRQLRTTANSIGPTMAALLLAYARNSGINPNDIGVFIQNDVLKEFIARGTYIYPPRPSLKISGDLVEYCARKLPDWTPLAVSGYHIRDSGGTAVQELAFTFVNAIAYMEEVMSRGLEVDALAGRIAAFFSAHIDFLEEVAKFRSARRIWARLLRDRFASKDPQAGRLKMLVYTMGGTMTAQQPLNNVVRVTIEALAAVLGGAQTLATTSFDEAYGVPTEEAVTLALRTQQVIAYESNVTNTVDPLGGSYMLECLTHEIETRVNEYIQRIDALGGAVACIESGFLERELSEAAYRHQKEIESGERVLVGVNRFTSEEDVVTPVFRVDPAVEQRQVARVRKLREERDNGQVRRALARLEDAARSGENTVPPTLEAVEAYATVGEISAALRKVYGCYERPSGF